MDLADLRRAAESGEIDTVLLAMTDMQGRLQGKRFHVDHFLDAIAEHAAEACNYLMAVDVEMNTVDGYAMASWDSGYGDFEMRPDLATLRPVPWQEGTAMCLADLAWEDGSDVVASPRQVLRRQLERLAERGWTANAGTELEFQVFRTSYEDAWKSGYRDVEPANLYNVDYSLLGTARVEPLLRRIRNAMHAAGLQVEDSKGECNLGQHEINFHYQRRAARLRRARDLQERRQGDGGAGRHVDHVHGQVRPARGQLVPHPPLAGRRGRHEPLRRRRRPLRPLRGRDPGHPAASSRCCSRPTSTPTSASPTGSFAPTALAWGTDNRTCSLRVVGHGAGAPRRVPARRRRPQPVPRARGADRRRAARHRRRARARAALHGQRLHLRSPARPRHAARRPRRRSPPRRWRARRSATRSSSTTSTTPGSS